MSVRRWFDSEAASIVARAGRDGRTPTADEHGPRNEAATRRRPHAVATDRAHDKGSGGRTADRSEQKGARAGRLQRMAPAGRRFRGPAPRRGSPNPTAASEYAPRRPRVHQSFGSSSCAWTAIAKAIRRRYQYRRRCPKVDGRHVPLSVGALILFLRCYSLLGEGKILTPRSMASAMAGRSRDGPGRRRGRRRIFIKRETCCPSSRPSNLPIY